LSKSEFLERKQRWIQPWRKDPGPGWSGVSHADFGRYQLGLMEGREGKCGDRVQNNARSVNKATQRTTSTMKRSFSWHVFFIKYIITVIVRDAIVNKAWLDV
jgi:hypothetical protein